MAPFRDFTSSRSPADTSPWEGRGVRKCSVRSRCIPEVIHDQSCRCLSYLTSLREIDARIKRKVEQLEKKDKALEALRRDSGEVEKKRAAIDQQEGEVVAERKAAQEALESLQAQRSQVEQLVVPEVHEAAKQRIRDQGVLLQQVLGFFTATVDGKPGDRRLPHTS